VIGVYHSLLKMGFLPTDAGRQPLRLLLRVMNHKEAEREIEESRHVYSVTDW